MFTVILLAFGALGTRLVMLQIVDAPAYAQIALDQRKRTVLFPARRGTIFDREGQELAISVDMQTIWADPQLVDDPVAEADKLAPLLDMKVEEVASKLTGTSQGSRFEYIMRQAEPSVANEIEKLELAGVYVKPEAKRHYPNDRLASHVLGFSDVDGKGVAGIELQYEDILQGKPGEMVLEQDPSGNPLPQAEFSYEGPEAGRSLFLTIDKDLQFFTETTLARAADQYNAKAATAIIMRPQTGEILALANVPDYDPNRTGDFSKDEQRNRAITDVFEPGSIYKLVTGGAALQEKVVTPKTTYVVPDEFPYLDRVFHDSHPHPTEVMTVSDIITDSSNVGTIQIGLDLGADALDKYVYKFGFGSQTGLDFPGESKGLVLPREDWSGTTIATIPIGQGIAVTALQMAAAYSTIANDGVWTEPKLLSATMNSEGKVLESPAPARKRVVSRSTAHKVTRILERVVKEGTGTAAAVPGYDVAGKTGTAQKVDEATGTYGHEYVASFAGYAPADNPEIAIIVSFDEPELIYGGDTAAPTFSTIAEFALRHLGVTPSEDAAKAAEKAAEADAENAPAYD
ncbi:MAG TPA: penicillin-binding protein 2 [Actinomycetota bacterium]|nr:penicillin-binding protein 2 [Actinomycetota bacterium]